jgi:hypothetical protein
VNCTKKTRNSVLATARFELEECTVNLGKLFAALREKKLRVAAGVHSAQNP